jgi:hypothetical protein
MIYTNLKGGLGNMMFQIAATLSMAIDKGVDASFPNLMSQLININNDSFHNSKLKHSIEYLSLFDKLLTEQPPQGLKTYRYPFHYDSTIPEGNEFIIDGFFQSEKYFKKNEKKIKEILTVPKNVLDVINIKYKLLLELKTTAIHVRRGDYLKFPKHHPTQSVEYYKKSIELLNNTEKFIIFSDDIEWCKSNFIGDEYYFIENEKDYVELYLMSMCNNVITSNSSFSWWGAWLNNNTDKIIVGPNIWFGVNTNYISKDILPKEWIKL